MLLDPTLPDPYFPDPKYRPTDPAWGPLNPATNQPVLYHAMGTIPENLPLDPGFAEISAAPTLSDLWANVELTITPESQGEMLVNQIYGRDDNGIPLTPPSAPLPDYNPGDLATPAAIVSVKNTLTKAGDAIKDTVTKYAFIIGGVLVAAIVVYAFAGAYGRKLAS